MPSSRIAADIYNIADELLRSLRTRQPCAALTEERLSALLTLSESGKASIKELAESEHIAHSTMSRHVSALAATGFTSISDHESDMRMNVVTLTEKGQRTIQCALRQTTRPLAAAIANLLDDEAAVLTRAVDVLRKVVSSVSDPASP